MEPGELESLEERSQRSGVPEVFIKAFNGRIDTPEEEEALVELWEELSPEDKKSWKERELSWIKEKTVLWKESLEEEEEKKELERELGGQVERYLEYKKTGHDPLEILKQQEKEKEEEYNKLISRAQVLGIPASKIPPKEHMDLLEDLVEREERTLKLKEQRERTELSKERWKKRAAVAVGIGAGLHTVGYLARGTKKAVIPPRAKSERISDIYFGRAPLSIYSAPGLRIAPGRPQPTKPAVIHKGWASPFAQLMTQPTPKLRGFKSPLAEMVWPTRRPITEPLTRPTLVEEPLPRELQRYMERKGYEPVTSLRGMPAYFWIGTKQGSEPSSNAWVVRLQTGRYGLAGIGDRTGKPRSKISWKTPEEAIDAASDIPGQ